MKDVHVLGSDFLIRHGIWANPGKREDSRDKYLHEIRFKKTRNEFLRY